MPARKTRSPSAGPGAGPEKLTKRERELRAGMELFLKDGFDNTSIALRKHQAPSLPCAPERRQLSRQPCGPTW